MANKWAAAEQNRYQAILYAPSLDEQLPSDEPIRLLDEILRGLNWTKWEAAYSDGAGRPPVHPRLMAGVILHGMMNRIRSSRELEKATRLRIDFHWYLDGMTIDHSTFAKFRNKFGDQLQTLLSDINKAAREAVQATIKRVAIDGTSVRANSNRHGARTARWLQEQIASVESKFSEIMAEMDMLDAMDGLDSDSIKVLEKRKTELEEKQRKLEAALEVARERDEAKRRKDGKKATEVRVPVTDPDSSILPNKDGGYAPNYTATASVDTETGCVFDAGVPTGGDEASAVRETIENAEESFEGKPEEALFDSHFASGENLEFLDDNGVEAFAPSEAAKPNNPAIRPDPTQPIDDKAIETILGQKGKLNKSYFIYDAEKDCYYCPLGRKLVFYRTVTRNTKDGRELPVREYKCSDCADCPLACKCLSRKAKSRTVTRDEYEKLREELAARMRTETAKEIYRQRAPSIEGVFAHIKGVMNIRGFLTRGQEKVLTEWRWICSAYSLRRLMNILTAKANSLSAADTNNPSETTSQPARALNLLFFGQYPQIAFSSAA